jgi:hypothetical protein
LKYFAAVLGVTLLMLFPAIWNGFPLVYSDTGTYIASGFQSFVPHDRPLAYGFILRHTSLSESLWFTVAAQALFTALLLWAYYKLFLQQAPKPKTFLILGIALAIFSTLPWYSSFLMADAFTGQSFLLFLFLCFGLNQNPWRNLGLVLLYWLLTATHLTHANTHLFVWAVLLLLMTYKPIRKVISFKRWAAVGLIVLLNYLFLPSFHWLAGNYFGYPQKSYYYLSSRFSENGSMKVVLDQHCPDKNWKLCAYKDSLPNNGSDFLWTDKSPLNKLNGWGQELTELKEINKAVMLQPDLWQLNLHHFVQIAWKQIGKTAVAEEYLVYDTLTPPGWETANHFRNELSQYLQSKQQQDTALAVSKPLSKWMNICLVLSLVILLLSVVSAFGSTRQNLVILLSLAAYVGNVLAVSIASEGARYNSRLYWIFPMMAILIVLKYFKEKWRFKQT